jgi:ATP-dependent RNA helicase HelY
VRNKLVGRDLGEPPPPPATAEDAAEQIARLRRSLRQHPCHACEDREAHVHQAERAARLRQEVERLESTVAGRSHVIARTFKRVCNVLTRLGYLDGDTVTSDGRRLADLYTELDLLAAECLRRGLWDGLSPADLAACVSALTFESRSPEVAGPRLPGGRVRAVLAAMVSVWHELDKVEKENRVSFLREPDLGFAWAAHAWASGMPLESVLDPDLTPGDFIRAVKQLIDLLGQIAVAAGRRTPLGVSAGTAMDALRRGVVAYSSLQEDAEADDALAAAEEP